MSKCNGVLVRLLSSFVRYEPDEQRDYFWVRFFLIAVALFQLGDLIEDRLDGAPFTHLITESLIVLTCTFSVAVIWLRSLQALRVHTQTLTSQLEAANKDLHKWREENASLNQGISDAIAKQLSDWGLSDAEQDIAFLLLKGLSFKEIAAVRETSERTVRQQAASIYQKSKLEGRAQLSAFFLEDILSPRAH